MLVGFLLDPVGDGRLSDCQTRLMGHQREQVDGFLEAVKAPSGCFAIKGIGLRVTLRRRSVGSTTLRPTGSRRARTP